MVQSSSGGSRQFAHCALMLTTTLLSIAAAILAILTLYGALYAITATRFLFLRLRDRQVDLSTAGNQSVAVLVPSENEGDAVVDTVETLLSQEYAGPILVDVLIKDRKDSSFEPLKKRFSLNKRLEHHRDGRTLRLTLTGHRGKTDKINYALKSLKSVYVAFLDADHRADPRWIAASVATLRAKKSDAVQSVRGPLDARKLFQFWDSAENHLGNEVFNHVFDRLGLPSFFTGTTCLFKSSVFENEVFPASITEDTFLSYRLILGGKKLAYNGAFGSFEEVAPDLNTYLARRRRWSCGHNQTFFAHFAAILKSRDLGPLCKLQLLFHGAYFLLPTLIVVLVNCLGLFYFLQLTDNVKALATFAALCAAGVLALATSNGTKERLQNLILSFVWVFPQIAMASILIYWLAGDELYFQIISFPYSLDLAWLHLLLIALPLVLLFLGSIRLGRPSPVLLLLYLPTFPIILFLDIFSTYLGFMDFLLGRTAWGRMSRSNSIEASFLPERLRHKLITDRKVTSRFWYLALVPAVAAGLVVVNDLLVFENCGHPIYLLGKPIVFARNEADPHLKLTVAKASGTRDGYLRLMARLKVESKSREPLRVGYRIQDDAGAAELQWHDVPDGNVELPIEADIEMGFATKSLIVNLQGRDACHVERRFSTALIEIRNGRLFLNGEPFLLKGVIPSFRTAQIDVPLEAGLRQIKDLGANTIRLYHQPTDEIRRLARELSLMLVVQPNDSTWMNIDMAETGSDKRLAARYQELVDATEGEPQILIDNLGNELELTTNRDAASSNIAKAVRRARRSEEYRFPLSYSTYGIFYDYPLDLVGINMLDTGNVYWRDGLRLLRDKQRAFYASEFGGFVAFYESVDPLIRARRIRNYWDRLTSAGSSGAIFFQSHDNWAQPVMQGFNDPFRPEQPDDLRGVWDHNNKPKFVHQVLKRLYADVDLAWATPTVVQDADGSRRTAQIRNRRAYDLRDLTVTYGGETVFEGHLAPGTGASFEILCSHESHAEFMVTHTTHRGLASRYSVELLVQEHLAEPYVVNPLARFGRHSPGRYDVELYGEDRLDFYLPRAWERYTIDGREFSNGPGLNTYEFQEPSLAACVDVQWATEPGLWQPLHDGVTQGGMVHVRAKLPPLHSIDDYVLVLEGTGGEVVEFLQPSGPIRFRTHSYRENRIPLSKLSDAISHGWLNYRIDRTSTLYIHARFNPRGTRISVAMQPPRLERVHRIQLARAP